MRVRFLTCDVFTDTRFGGNALAVLPDATGLTDAQMQQVAREFNYSESTFVLPSEHGHDRRVRIFTPTREVPFAGHPNVGTAFALAATGEFGSMTSARTVTFEEVAGLVPVRIEPRGPAAWWSAVLVRTHRAGAVQSGRDAVGRTRRRRARSDARGARHHHAPAGGCLGRSAVHDRRGGRPRGSGPGAGRPHVARAVGGDRRPARRSPLHPRPGWSSGGCHSQRAHRQRAQHRRAQHGWAWRTATWRRCAERRSVPNSQAQHR